jgi:hypothetical protein
MTVKVPVKVRSDFGHSSPGRHLKIIPMKKTASKGKVLSLFLTTIVGNSNNCFQQLAISFRNLG